MLRVQTSFVFVPAADLRAAVRGLVRLPVRRASDGRALPHAPGAVARAEAVLLRCAATAAFREVVAAAKGLEIHHLQFAFHGLTVAVAARVRQDGVVELEAGLGNPALPFSALTTAQAKAAEEAARRRDRLHRRVRALTRA